MIGAGRLVGLVTITGGALTAGAGVARLARSPDATTATMAVVLGSRQVLQGAVVAALPHRRIVAAAAVVDVLHAISMAACVPAARHARTRALATASAALATFAAVVEANLARAS
ncbi:hypothetical protein [Fodinicola acaciae]|uniref:hypothetical protein n=1 Tax=Fodinicola acaciae TaxID=2681555 RepID=UPI0013D3B3BC|nr:hypothetical protein [Fodinicola acaciae]